MSTVTQSKEEALAGRAFVARKLANAAQRKANRVAADPEANRSTRQRAALKIKADALDQIVDVFAGKD